MEVEQSQICLTVLWDKKEFKVKLPETSTVMDLKLHMTKATGVIPSRQKLMGLRAVGGKVAPEDHLLKDLISNQNSKLLMIGSLETNIIVADDNVVSDFELSAEPVKDVKSAEENLQKIQVRIGTYKFNQLCPPRLGKKLLVLDVDYTLFDHKSTAESVKSLMRPHLHEFLNAVYDHYDVFIWSATSMKWIVAKMCELGVTCNENYKITAHYGAMITIHNPKYGIFNTKPLQIIWSHYSSYYSPENTIALDDLSRNFIMNPQNGLKIRSYKNAPKNCKTDDELLHLTTYLLAIAKLDTFVNLNHNNWKSYINYH